MVLSDSCSQTLRWATFFLDAPWLNIPAERKGDFIAPLHPRGGLLGGSPGEGPKMSKLQALAAERKKKQQEQKERGSSGVEKAMTNIGPIKDAKFKGGKYPAVNSTGSLTPQPIQEQTEEKDADASNRDNNADPAEPSDFASTMFSATSPAKPRHRTDSSFTLPYITATASVPTDPFAGLSPDDIVLAAQIKGSSACGRS